MPLYYRRFEIAGIVCSDPKILKHKATGVDNCIMFSVAYNTKSGDEFKSSFYNIHIYSGNKTFDNARFISKGQNIFCTGDIKRETWTKEVGGTKRYEERVYLDCHDFRIISNKEESATKAKKIDRANERREQNRHKYSTDDAAFPVAEDNLPEPTYEYEDNNPDIPF